MRCGDHLLDPPALYGAYLRDLVLVARCGDANARRLFLERYAPQLEGLESQICVLAGWEQEYAFTDAARVMEESAGPPHSLLGFRLALPKWFRARVPGPCAVRRSAVDAYLPERLIIDPVCGMLVDPQESLHTLLADGEEVAFCCAHCLATYEIRVRAVAPAAEATAS